MPYTVIHFRTAGDDARLAMCLLWRERPGPWRGALTGLTSDGGRDACVWNRNLDPAVPGMAPHSRARVVATPDSVLCRMDGPSVRGYPFTPSMT